ncbi:hypothetical protein NLU13_9778 [Sarocladium strictum]|uniref:Amino acid transporter transmembrane domain-containing protein n=1 Tax=Sarocladium strictum TaxID=5046 RepID=A0AA39L3D6_SARSR|nr:hypothetical protein NLU13_9778 [Sarocladium strictum]
MSLEEKKLPVEMPGDAESAQGHGEVTHQDAVFGEITEKGPNYRSLGWIGTSGLMMKTQIGLGVLSFPSVFDTLGMIPGVIILLFIGALTTWSNYIVGVFKLRHRHIYGIDDVGMLLFGRIGKEVVAFVFMGFYVMTAGSAMLSISIALNALSEHGACTAVFVAAAFVAVMAVASVRTLGRIGCSPW